MTNLFQKATRGSRYARIGIYGGSGFGKTLTALKFAAAIAKEEGGRFAVIDTEKGSSSLYATEGDKPPQNEFEYDFDAMFVDAPFTTQKAINGINAAVAGGYKCAVIDSASHFWFDEGGVLSQADLLKKNKFRGDGFRAIAEAKRVHYNPFVEAIIAAPIHIIVTLRVKNAYDISKKEVKGKERTQIERLGVAPRMEESFIYELDLALTMSGEAVMSVEKTRKGDLADVIIEKPDGDWILGFYHWVNNSNDPYVYGDGTRVPQNPQTRRVFNGLQAENGGEAPYSSTNLQTWFKKQEAKAAEPTPPIAPPEEDLVPA